MFLCSRDIQVGDKYKVPKYPGSNEYDDVERYASEPMEDSFKVIGEISPDATWVKEGDEFDENEIEFRKYSFCFSKPQPDTHFNNPIRYPYYMSHTLVSEGRDEHSRSYSYIIITEECIKIKGTCGHFH